MMTELNQYLTRTFLAAIDRHGMQAARQYLSPKVQVTIQGLPQPLNRDEYLAFGARLYGAFSSFRHSIQTIQGEGDQVNLFVIGSGFHSASLGDLPATQRYFQVPAEYTLRFLGGKITHLNLVVDAEEVLVQLGVLPQPEMI